MKGIAVGNGCTGFEVGVCSGRQSTFVAQYFVETTAFVKPDLKKKMNDNCNWDTHYDISPACNASIEEMHEELYWINSYLKESDAQDQDYPLVQKDFGNGFVGLNSMKDGPTPCIDGKPPSTYLNQDEVIDAIHVQKQNKNWNVCNPTVGRNYIRTRPNLPRDTYPFLTEHIRILIYNGDWDAKVPYTDNYKWTKDMGFEIVEDWHQWFYKNSILQDNLMSINNVKQRDEVEEQVGGYAIRYAHNFTFITVRGGAHEVPATAPASSFEMLRRFLKGIDF